MQGFALRNWLRFLKGRDRSLPKLLSQYRRRQLTLAVAAKKPRPSRRERHLARVAERDAAAAEFAAQKPVFED